MVLKIIFSNLYIHTTFLNNMDFVYFFKRFKFFNSATEWRNNKIKIRKPTASGMKQVDYRGRKKWISSISQFFLWKKLFRNDQIYIFVLNHSPDKMSFQEKK